MTTPNLRCKNCWRPYALHTEGQDKHGGWHMWCPDCQDEYEPDSSPEARVYAAVEALIAAAQGGRDFNYTTLGRALNELRGAASAERTK